MLTGSTALKEVFEFAPEWEQLLRNFDGGESPQASEFLSRVGARAIFHKALGLTDARDGFVRLLRDFYYQPLLSKMLASNSNLRRFLSQRRVSADEQRSQVISYSVDLSQKLEASLNKQLAAGQEDGFKVLLPAYIQRTVQNAVVDYIRHESAWERQTLQDLYLDSQQEDPRATVADDISYSPEHQALSGEQVVQLNQLRVHLTAMLADGGLPKEPLTVVDCLFGLGLTSWSVTGEELTMREVCDKLDIQAETMARRIARCQVLLDKGLDLVRQKIYNHLPGIAQSWQRGLNLNTASRRELTQQLGMTEGEIERLIKGRQIENLQLLPEKGIIKPARLKEIVQKGAVAVFVPVDINSATGRDIMDILGVAKETAQSLVAERPFGDLSELAGRNLVGKAELQEMIRRGAVLRTRFSDSRRLDLNRVSEEDITKLGVSQSMCLSLVRLRPFLTWAEAEDFLQPESADWAILRQKCFLGLSPG